MFAIILNAKVYSKPSDYVLGRDDAIFNDISGLAQHKELIHRQRDITSDVYVMAGWIYDLVLQGRK